MSDTHRRMQGFRLLPLSVAPWLMLVGMASGLAQNPEGTAAGPPASAADTEAVDYECDQPGSNGQALVDRVQRGVYASVCGTARWFDGLFGTRRYDQDSDATYGRLMLHESWDDRDDFDTSMRLRARIALPTFENRLQLILGRVEDSEIAEDAQPHGGSALPANFARVDDEDWLLGLGYSKQDGLENGFDFGAGVRIRTPLDPYVKSSYRHNFIFSEATALRARQTLFWRDSRGAGETTEIDLDHLLSTRLLFRWNNTASLVEDLDGLEWSSALILFQSLGRLRGMSYTGFVTGMTDTDVPVRNYGFEARYRRQVYREWLFMELRTSVTWPKEARGEDRDINPGVGLGLEMYFGPVPPGKMR